MVPDFGRDLFELTDILLLRLDEGDNRLLDVARKITKARDGFLEMFLNK